MQNHTSAPPESANIPCVGLGWFSTTLGGMKRYGYELIQQSVAGGDQISLCGVGLPRTIAQPSIVLASLADPNDSLPKRLGSVHQRFRHQLQQMPQPSAINLHFALCGFPLLQDLPALVLATLHPEIWLAVAGKGAQRESLEQQVSALGLEHEVKFLGFLPDEQLPIAYQAADLTIMPSQSLEGFGLVLLESLDCGTPVLCTPVGGMPETLAEFSPHLLAKSTDAEAVAERLTDLLDGKSSLPSQAAWREYACSNFDWQIIAPQVPQILLNPNP